MQMRRMWNGYKKDPRLCGDDKMPGMTNALAMTAG